MTATPIPWWRRWRAATPEPEPAPPSTPAIDFFADIDTALRRFAPAFRPRTVFDVGAFQGDFTARLLTIFPEADCHLFEAQPDTFARLQDRFAGDARIRATHAALLDREGEVTFHRGHFAPTSSLFPRNCTGHAYFAPEHDMAETVRVPGLTLDAHCAAAGIEAIDILKLDTQGAEHAILRGAAGLLGAGRISLIFTEFFAIPHYEGAPLFDEIWSLLRGHGYDLYDIFLGQHGQDGQLRYGDAIFLSPGFRRDVLPRLR